MRQRRGYYKHTTVILIFLFYVINTAPSCWKYQPFRDNLNSVFDLNVFLFSLPNVSKDIRWSLDLRWQRPDEPFGLWNLKPGVVMRSSTDPKLKPDWETFCSIDRTAAQKESIKDFLEVR